MLKPIAIFGGTFDPVHLGHIALATAITKQLDLEELRFMPCYQSPFKKLPLATTAQRLTMLKLALNNQPEFIIDERELQHKKVSYSFNALRSIRDEIGNQPLCFIMSQDAFSKFNLWHKWKEMLTLCHLVVANRPDNSMIPSEAMSQIITERQTNDKTRLTTKNAGYISFIEIEPNPISATNIRQLIQNGQDVSAFLSPPVWEFIQQNNLYN